jgi:hypothetical protein
MYFLAMAVVTLLVIVSAITAFYDGPDDSQSPDADFGIEDTLIPANEAQADYNRNVSLILQVTSAGLFATAVLGLGSRFNPLRGALVLGGLAVYLAGVGFWAESSDQWLGFLMTLGNFLILGIGFLWLEEGLPLEPREVRRIDLSPSRAVPAPVVASPPPPPPPPPPSSPTISPEPPATTPPGAPDSKED